METLLFNDKESDQSKKLNQHSDVCNLEEFNFNENVKLNDQHKSKFEIRLTDYYGQIKGVHDR